MVSVNVQRVTGRKLADILAWARSSPYDVVFLQELALRQPDPFSILAGLPSAGAHWPGASFWCPGTAHSRGCLTLVKTSSPVVTAPAAPAHVDPAGRVLRVDVHVNGQEVALVNVYAPAGATAAERRAFFSESLRPQLPTDGRPLVVAIELHRASRAHNRHQSCVASRTCPSLSAA